MYLPTCTYFFLTETKCSSTLDIYCCPSLQSVPSRIWHQFKIQSQSDAPPFSPLISSDDSGPSQSESDRTCFRLRKKVHMKLIGIINFDVNWKRLSHLQLLTLVHNVNLLLSKKVPRRTTSEGKHQLWDSSWPAITLIKVAKHDTCSQKDIVTVPYTTFTLLQCKTGLISAIFQTWLLAHVWIVPAMSL